ncbi:hypothetical protein A1359_15325 [Methylomonas lenta]|uniref:GNAT family N-acetyltransferase n=1 Tax=Methylomonas lenta TaxID=980561 RepID=A0A177MZD5_9GAMM|nr:GNAT family N-acetyltransferase [Methylomonas lenta]OAI11066.1 hypothetical protein A1359_15325 [Methylomonas lenta]
MDVKIITRLAEIDQNQWNALTGVDYPFLRHEFLSALEHSGSVSEQTGWQPQHILILDDNQLLAIMPMYLKSHSRGEYVFDQTWAQAYQSHGLAYYPKYVTSIPYTPCQGVRLAIQPDVEPLQIIDLLLKFIQQNADHQSASSWHCLFPDTLLQDTLQSKGLIIREDVQFQWFNRGYRTLDDFLQTLTASKRKMIKRERRKVSEQGIHLQRLEGKAINDTHWQTFYRFYALTYLKRNGQPYLNLAFFRRLAETMPEALQLILAIKQQTPVAASLFFVGADTLYGRYWGCAENYDALHFETCYYQGIEYCIEQGLRRFDSGAQGEHKIARGFEPVSVYSAHWIKDARFSQAIADFVNRERIHVNRYKSGASDYLPFKQNVL